MGPPLSFAGPWAMWWECGGVSVGARGARGGKYIPAGAQRCDVAVVSSWQPWGLWGSRRGLEPLSPVVMWRLWGRAFSAALLCLVSLWLPGDVSLAWARPRPYPPHVSG